MLISFELIFYASTKEHNCQTPGLGLDLGIDFTFTCQRENHGNPFINPVNPWIKPRQPSDKTTATQENPHHASTSGQNPTCW